MRYPNSELYFDDPVNVRRYIFRLFESPRRVSRDSEYLALAKHFSYESNIGTVLQQVDNLGLVAKIHQTRDLPEEAISQDRESSRYQTHRS